MPSKSSLGGFGTSFGKRLGLKRDGPCMEAALELSDEEAEVFEEL
jgi:hypothetical protein